MTEKSTKPAPDGETHDKPLYGKVPELLMHNLSITDGTCRLFAHMWWRYGKNKDNHEGHKSMATLMGVSEATISNRIEELEFHGWIVVVELERSQKSGNYRTPYYHLFLDQNEAEIFRKEYKCKDGESVRPKPTTTREKKSRKGKGGKPSNIVKYNEINQSNSSSHSHSNSSSTGGTNSSQNGGTNPSWSELDSSDLDSSDLNNTNTPHTPAPNGLGGGSNPQSETNVSEIPNTSKTPDPKHIQDLYDKQHAQTDSTVSNHSEEKPQPDASAAIPQTPGSAAPLSQPEPKPDAVEQAIEFVNQSKPVTTPPINDEMAAKLIINAFLTATKSADVKMLDNKDRKREALILYEDGMRPQNIQTFVEFKKTAPGYWHGQNVTWTHLIGNIISHFDTHPLIAGNTWAAIAAAQVASDDDTPPQPVFAPIRGPYEGSPQTYASGARPFDFKKVGS